MKKNILFFALIMAISISINAQEEAEKVWKTGSMGSLSFSQVALTNWAAGGESSISGNLLFNMFANYKKGKSTWDNTFDFGYGSMKQGDFDWRKTDDKIELASKYGQYAFEHWYYSALVNFKTQMTTGFNYSDDPDIEDVEISQLMAPAYLNIALGMDYKPNDDFSLLVSPLSGKITFVNDTLLSNAGSFGVEPGDKIRSEFGAYIKMTYKHDIMENVALSTKLDLFSNYMENPQNIDINLELLISMKINKYLTATISATMIYDDDIMIADDMGKVSPRIQMKEVFGIGIAYKF
ncbi:MAG: DUF3078 domain-containing protein [Bacteroidota bacterium]|nr:DUF3078 domain-containing protein [Bacteroidota bacterium]